MVALISGIAMFADAVATRLYKYTKAVKDWEAEVIKLRCEVDILSGILYRLGRISNEEDEQKKHEEEEMGRKNEQHAGIEPVEELPGFFSVCMLTLTETDLVLVSFETKVARISADHDTDGLRVRQSIFSRLSRSDLKWPFKKSKTMDLIATLERHKATCILALETQEPRPCLYLWTDYIAIS